MARPGKLLTAIAAISMAAFLFGDTRTEAIRALLALERRQLAADTRRFTEATRKLETALTDLSAASRAASDAASRPDGPSGEAGEALARAASALQSLVLDQRLSLERIADDRERIAGLEHDSGGRPRREDPLSGDWKMRVDPGEQEGDLHLSLDGTLVSGDYTLEGGFTGSVRGTLVSDRLKLDRIDSRLGLNAVYYGRLSRDGSTLSGTWESMDVSGGAATSGTWSARKQAADQEER